jgi:hypothetical protein
MIGSLPDNKPSIYAAGVLSGADRIEVSVLEPPMTRGAVRDLLDIRFARFQDLEEHPLVFASYPPDLSPDFVLLLAWAT